MFIQKSHFREEVCELIVSNLNKIQSWFDEKTKGKIIPFYSSFDIRDSGFKMGCVDANVFPAGFNNICEVDQKTTSSLIKDYLERHYPSCKKILLLAEEHTKNLYYWDNIYVIKSLIESVGYKVTVCVPGKMITSQKKIITASGKEVSIHLLTKEKGDLIISNNDFSVHYDFQEDRICNPCIEMGWGSRRKHNFFMEYNKIASEFASILGLDPWCFRVETELFSPFDLDSDKSRKLLEQQVTLFLKNLKNKQIKKDMEEPYVFLKNNSGTYGLGVMTINKAEELDHLNYKKRKKMKASKSGLGIKELIIQEGIPTVLGREKGLSVEPVIYMVGADITGGFLRGHDKQGYKANLNSPGAVYKRLCVSDLKITIHNRTMEHVYGWVGKLGVLALISEIENRHLDFRGYQI